MVSILHLNKLFSHLEGIYFGNRAGDSIKITGNAIDRGKCGFN